MSTFRTILAAAVAAGLFSAQLAAAPIAVRVQNMDVEPDAGAAEPAVSADGKTVVFTSTSSNLAPAGHGELYSYDVRADQVRSLTKNNDGHAYAPAVSETGRYIAFATDDNEIGQPDCVGTGNGNDVLRADLSTNPPTFLRASRAAACTPGNPVAANGSSATPAISGDGNYVAFNSGAGNLVVPATATNRGHIFEMNMTTRELTLVTRASTGAEANGDTLPLENNAYSRDGRALVFASDATNLATVFGGNVSDAILRRIDRATGVVSFENLNRSIGGTVGTQSSSRPSISPNGRYVVFLSNADNLLPGGRSGSRFYLRDVVDNTLRGLALPAQMGACVRGRVDDRGDVLLQCSPAQGSGLTAQQLYRLYVDGRIELLSKDRLNGGFGNGGSGDDFSVSADGRLVVTTSAATNLIAADGNGDADVFMIAEPKVFDELFGDGFE